MQALIWKASQEEMQKGYVFDPSQEAWVCLACGRTFEEGRIFRREDGVFLTAEKNMRRHIEEDHGGMFQYLLDLNKKFTGLTENQKQVLSCFREGLSDFETAGKLKLSQSTVRNYRFKFREREKQAKVFSALMELLYRERPEEARWVEVHPTATMVDDRYQVTEEEAQAILGKYFDGAGRLIDFPKKEKRKIVLLRAISQHFKPGRQYSEKEVNRLLERIYDDYVLIRRYLIEYGFLDRKNDGSAYWRK